MPSPIDNMKPEDAPDWFWTLIERSEGDRERLQELATALSQDELKQAFEYYRMLASYMPEDLDEDPAFDLANWIVAQGKDLYFGIYKGRTKTPQPTRSGRGLWSVLAEVYWDRFGKNLV